MQALPQLLHRVALLPDSLSILDKRWEWSWYNNLIPSLTPTPAQSSTNYCLPHSSPSDPWAAWGHPDTRLLLSHNSRGHHSQYGGGGWEDKGQRLVWAEGNHFTTPPWPWTQPLGTGMFVAALSLGFPLRHVFVQFLVWVGVKMCRFWVGVNESLEVYRQTLRTRNAEALIGWDGISLTNILLSNLFM